MSLPSGPFYRVAGLSYLRYSNLCADLLRNVLKEPFKAKAMPKQSAFYKYSPYSDGKAGKTSGWPPGCMTCASWLVGG